MAEPTIDLKSLIKRLPPDKLGMFEPVSGLMLLNLSAADFQEAALRLETAKHEPRHLEIYRTINHELFHFAQTIASGYMYQRQLRLHAFIDEGEAGEVFALEQRREELEKRLAAELGPEPTEEQLRGARVVTLVTEMERLSTLSQRAAEDDHTLAGAVFPRLFRHAEELERAERETNPDGLSILHLIEGSAVVHAELLLLGGAGGGWAAVEAQMASLPQEYRVLPELTVAQCGARAAELLLPATALALRYARPHDAYPALLELLAESPAGGALERGRSLGAELPPVEGAGPRLGTAIDVHRAAGENVRTAYGDLLNELASGAWRVDSYELLADPDAMSRLPPFPLGCILSDSWLNTGGQAQLGARMLVMSIMLRVRSRSRDERDLERAMKGWLADFGRRWFGGDEPSS